MDRSFSPALRVVVKGRGERTGEGWSNGLILVMNGFHGPVIGAHVLNYLFLIFRDI
jgi:hypothetical protein